MSEVKFREYHNAGYKVFGLYGITENHKCGCLSEECEALFKHPRIPSWQTIPLWSDEQLNLQETKMNHFEKGFGVLCDDIFVIDVDARNGGLDSFYQLQDDLDIDLIEECRFIVNTGSQDGSMHLYFKAPVPALALQQVHAKYEGIDFKSSGFVVGLGSAHKSGHTYTLKKGDISEVGEIPQVIIDILKKVAHTRTKFEGETIDVSDQELHDIVMHIANNNCDYDKWISIGMAIHDATQGSSAGFSIWLAWSAQSSKHDDLAMEKKWNSFGSHSNKATIGTLYHYAKQDGGYTFPVKFNNLPFETPAVEEKDLLFIEHVDIRRPPGVAGELTQWVNDQCLYPRENHAAAAALYILSACGGMKHYDALNGMGLNLIMFCVAGSSTGKDSILSAIEDCLDYVKISGAFHSGIKSDAEIYRNMMRNQSAYYVIDELGLQLKKIQNAMKRGGASYLEAVFATLMSAYGRSEKSLKMTGDVKEEMRDIVNREIAKINKMLDDPRGKEEELKENLERLILELQSVDKGLQRPYLHIFGGTTPRTFNDLVDYESATNGFMARAMMFVEHEDNPRWKIDFKKRPLDMGIKSVLNNLYWGGFSNDPFSRVEQKGERVPIKTTEVAEEALEEVKEYFWNVAEDAKEHSGLQAIPRRGFEICAKVSLILAMADGKDRELEHVRYGFAVAKADIEEKIRLAFSNDNEKDKEMRGNALVARVLSHISKEEPTTFGVLKNKMRGVTKDELEATLEFMKQKKIASVEMRKNAKNRDTVYIQLLQ